MVMATRSDFEGEPSLAGCALAATGGGDGNSVTWPVLASPRVNSDGAERAAGAADGSEGSIAGAAAVAIPADDVLPPSKRFQSEGA